MASDDIVLTDTGDTFSSPVTPMDRGNGHGHENHSDEDECIAEDEVLVGPVCVDADIITVELEDILTT